MAASTIASPVTPSPAARRAGVVPAPRRALRSARGAQRRHRSDAALTARSADIDGRSARAPVLDLCDPGIQPRSSPSSDAPSLLRALAPEAISSSAFCSVRSSATATARLCFSSRRSRPFRPGACGSECRARFVGFLTLRRGRPPRARRASSGTTPARRQRHVSTSTLAASSIATTLAANLSLTR